MIVKFGVFCILFSALVVSPIKCIPEVIDPSFSISASQETELEERSLPLLADNAPLEFNEGENVDIEKPDMNGLENVKNEDKDDAQLPNYQEADDMEYGGIFQNRTVFVESKPIDEAINEPIQELQEVKGVIVAEPIPSNLKYAVEWIESVDENTIDIDDIHSRPLHVIETWPWILTMMALAAMFVLFLIGSVFFYKLLTKRYNNRQILINEEDMIDPNDMKHFSL